MPAPTVEGMSALAVDCIRAQVVEDCMSAPAAEGN